MQTNIKTTRKLVHIPYCFRPVAATETSRVWPNTLVLPMFPAINSQRVTNQVQYFYCHIFYPIITFHHIKLYNITWHGMVLFFVSFLISATSFSRRARIDIVSENRRRISRLMLTLSFCSFSYDRRCVSRLDALSLGVDYSLTFWCFPSLSLQLPPSSFRTTWAWRTFSKLVLPFWSSIFPPACPC